MLVGKLKNSIKHQVELLPNKFEERVGDTIKVLVLGYELGAKKFSVRVELLKEKIEPLNPSSVTEEENEEHKFNVKRLDMIKIYQVQLEQDDLAKWGTDDADLIRVVAEKLNVEIESIYDLEEENKKVEESYKEYLKKKEEEKV